MSTPAEAKTTPEPAHEDLSAEIVRCVEKRAGDRITCRRITANKYRCNWWSAADTTTYDNPSMSGLLVTTHRVRKSRFLLVTRGDSGLIIDEAQC